MARLIAEFMKFIGTLAAIFLLASIFNYVIKGINKKYRKQIQAGKYKNIFNTLMKLTVKNHKVLGAMAIIMGLFHGIYQLNAVGYDLCIYFVLAGVVTLSCMVLLGILGNYGFWIMKSKKGYWFYAHRIIAALALIGLILHKLILEFR